MKIDDGIFKFVQNATFQAQNRIQLRYFGNWDPDPQKMNVIVMSLTPEARREYVSVADIPDSNFSVPDPGSDPQQRI